MSKGTEFANRWLDAATRGELDTLVSTCQPDVELSNPDGTFHGYEGVRTLFKVITDATSERECEVSNIVESGDSVVVEFIFRGNNTGPFVTPQSTIPATYRNFSLPTIAVYDLREGRLINSRGQYDRLTLMSQLGLIPAPASA